jgi:hypothetical protein
MTQDEVIALAVAQERQRWANLCKQFASNTNPPHKEYERYADGWLDACNEILWAGSSNN